MKLNIKVLLLFLGLFIVVIAGCGRPSGGAEADESTTQKEGSSTDDQTKDDLDDTKGDGEEGGEEEERLVPVEAMSVTTGPISEFILASSRIEAEQAVVVFAKVGGLILERSFEEGKTVKAGDVLVRLEADEFELAESMTRAAYDKTERDFIRTESMFGKKLISQETYDQARFTRDQAKVEWDQARIQLDHTRIRAPIPGIISSRMIQAGQRIQPGAQICSIVNMNSLVAYVNLPERELSKISIGQSARITGDALPGRVFDGKVLRVSPVVNPQSGTVKVTVAVQHPDAILRPGMFVSVRVVTNTRKDTVLLPKKAIVYESGLQSFYLVKDGLAQKLELVAGLTDAEHVEAMEGVKPGDQLIVVGQSGLKDGTRVRVVTQQDESDSEESNAEVAS